ncbi:MAG: hypothetical protein JJ971_14955 [Balneolaceae bacterium]|nr:hypothetical protein [Balneolaceae bacterium]MBO6547698.1 hypothetical protein [Balneolaceae bacterium]MBO6648209.1 hypothetical protein [Balneolaceae bacterium]
MTSRTTYFTYLVFFFALIQGITSGLSPAQETPKTDLGIYWEITPDPDELSEKLAEYEQLGVSFIEIQHPVNSSILDAISAYPFNVLIRFDKQFLLVEEIKNNKGQFVQDYQKLILEYAEFENVVAYGLYSFSQSFDEGFIAEFNFIENELESITSREFYEITSSNFNGLDFSITQIVSDSVPENSSSFLLSKNYSRNDLHLVGDIFKEQPVLFFIEANWLDQAISDYPVLNESLIDYKTSGSFILPLPLKTPSESEFNWPVFVFVLIWISLGIHIRVSGTYGPLIFRYFTGHRFFVDDVMRYRERSLVSGTFLLFQHAAFTGLVTYILAKLLISPKGLEALYHFLPQTAFFGQNYFSVFVIGMLISLLAQIIGLIWLYLPSKSMTHFSQALNLYSWIFHIDFVLVSIMLILLLSGGSGTLIMILGVLFFINWLIGFLLTSFDSSKYLVQKRLNYIFYTFGLHTVVNILLLVLILSNDYLIDMIELFFVL